MLIRKSMIVTHMMWCRFHDINVFEVNLHQHSIISFLKISFLEKYVVHLKKCLVHIKYVSLKICEFLIFTSLYLKFYFKIILIRIYIDHPSVISLLLFFLDTIILLYNIYIYIERVKLKTELTPSGKKTQLFSYFIIFLLSSNLSDLRRW